MANEQINDQSTKATPDGTENLIIQEAAGGAGSTKKTTTQAVANLATNASNLTSGTVNIARLPIDADVATFSVPASTTISSFTAGALDKTTVGAFLTALGIDADLATLAVPASTTISSFVAGALDETTIAAFLTALGLDADLATLALPASTTISTFMKTLLDDADAATARGTLGAAPTASPTFTGTVTLPTTETGTTAPIGSLTTRHGGVYVGKRALDKWRYTKQPYRSVVVLSDSLGQGDVGGLDPWPERLARDLGNWNGPRLTAGAGYYGLYRSGSLVFGAPNGDREWIPWGTWSTIAATLNYDLAPYSSGLICSNANATALRTVADGTTTVNSPAIGSATMAFVAGDVGSLITGTNIPPNSYIVSVPSATVAIISQPATATGSSLTQSIHGAVLSWTRPLGNNNCRMMLDNTTATNTTLLCPSANFHVLDIGKMVTGPGIAANTTITAITDYQTATISNATTSSASGRKLIIHDGRVVNDMVSTNTSTTMTSATAAFVSSDVGAKVVGTNIAGGTFIASVQSPTSVTLSTAATGTGSAQFLFIQTYQGMRAVVDMVSSAGTGTITSAAACFSQQDVGRQVTGTSIANNTTITAVTNSTTATISNTIATTNTAGNLIIGSSFPVSVAALDIYWIDGITSNGASFGYSTNGGTTWTAVTQAATGGPLLMKTTVTVANPTQLIIRANVGTSNTSAAKSQTIQAGIAAYAGTPQSAGINLFNVSRDGLLLATMIHGGVGDSMAFLDNGMAGTFPGWRPDLVVVLFSNDQLTSTSTAWTSNLNRLLDRVQSYADVVLLGTYEMGDGRALATTQAFNAVMKALINPAVPTTWTCTDGVTTNASATITSATIAFEQSDVGRTITDSAGKIPAATTITAVASATSATISANATGTTSSNTFTITGKSVDTGNAHIDLYEAYAAEGVTGYAAANADGLMFDTVHPSQIGHNEIGARVSRLIRVFS
jgi:hypothetical protein